LIGIFVLGALVVAGVVFLGVLPVILSLLFGIILLPFKLLGLLFKGIGFLLAVPLLALGAFALFLVVGVGILALLLPILPFALLVFGLVWLLRRRRHPTTA